LGKGFINLEV